MVWWDFAFAQLHDSLRLFSPIQLREQAVGIVAVEITPPSIELAIPDAPTGAWDCLRYITTVWNAHSSTPGRLRSGRCAAPGAPGPLAGSSAGEVGRQPTRPAVPAVE